MDTKQLLEAIETIKVVKDLFDTQQNEWIPVIAAIGGALVGGLSTTIPNFLIEWKKRRDESFNVRSALIAEVNALLTIIEHRKYIDSMRSGAEHLRNEPNMMLKYCVKIPEHYSRIYQAHIERIGSIDPALAAKIIQFHQLLDSIVQDIAPGGIVAEEGGGAETFEQLIQIADTAVAIGRDITKK